MYIGDSSKEHFFYYQHSVNASLLCINSRQIFQFNTKGHIFNILKRIKEEEKLELCKHGKA